MRFFTLLLLCCCVGAQAASTRPLPSPAGNGSMAPALAQFPDGTALLSWLEPAADDEWLLKWARFDAKASRWTKPQEISRGRDWFVNWADTPTVTPLSDDILMAVWFVNNPMTHGAAGHHGSGYHAEYSLSDDGGATWSKPQATTGESTVTEFTAVLALGANSRALAAWLDGRKRAAGKEEQALYAQTFLATGKDHLVDPLVCDCCQLSLARVRDGALLAYRGRTTDEVRDIRITRWQNGQWEKPRTLHADDWKIAACPVNGPRLAVRDAMVAAAWFTGAQEKPRVQVKFSTDAGATFGAAIQVDLGQPMGRVDAVALDASRALVSWLEMRGPAGGSEGGVYARVIGSDGRQGDPILLSATSTKRSSGFPRIAQVGEDSVLVAITLDGKPSRVETLLLQLK